MHEGAGWLKTGALYHSHRDRNPALALIKGHQQRSSVSAHIDHLHSDLAPRGANESNCLRATGAWAYGEAQGCSMRRGCEQNTLLFLCACTIYRVPGDFMTNPLSQPCMFRPSSLAPAGSTTIVNSSCKYYTLI